MPATKLTLSIDKHLIEAAKRLAGREGTSLSSMFTRFLEAVLRGRHSKDRPGPVTRKATGLVKLPRNQSDRALLADALAKKYRLG
mgnify:CR=1 FL=1